MFRIVYIATGYIATGIIMGRLVAHFAFRHCSYSTRDEAAHWWGLSTFLFWPPVLAVGAVCLLGYGAFRTLRLLIVPTEAR